MNLAPLIRREMRVAARRESTYRVRIAAAGTLCLVWAVLTVASSAHTPPVTLGQMLFAAMGALCLGLGLLAGVFLTADAISRERREGTLGLLFLTDLRPVEVVLAKLISSSVQASLGLLAVLPVLGLPLLLGSLSGFQFASLIGLLLVTLFYSLTLGMLVSVTVRDGRSAMVSTMVVIGTLAGILPAVWWLVKAVPGLRVLEPVLLWPSPGFGFWAVISQARLQECLLTLSGIGVFALGAACVVLARTGRRETVRPVPRRTQTRGPLPLGQHANPAEWLARREGRARASALRILGALLPLWAVAWSGMGPTRSQVPYLVVALLLGFALHLTFKCLVAFEATRRFSEDATNGALELLLVTPLPVSRLVRGYAAGLGRSLRGPAWLLTGVNGLLLARGVTGDVFSLNDAPAFFAMFVTGAVMLWVDLWAVIWTGLYQAVCCRRHNRAAWRTIGQILLPPWLAIVLLIFLSRANVFQGPHAPYLILGFWFALGFLVSGVSAGWSKAALLDRLRSLVAEETPGGSLKPQSS